MIDLAPEASLVLACARVAPDAEGRERIARLAAPELDWNRVAALAKRHGLLPLLHRNLATIADRVPKPMAAAAWGRAESVARRNRAMAAELARILPVLEAAGIAAVPYKGPVLTLALYGELGLREFGDLDLLVSRRDVARARAVLCEHGYRAQHPMDEERERLWISSPRLYELAVVDASRNFIVELQWRADPAFAVPAIDDPRWWATLGWRPFEGLRVRAMDDAELVAALLVHGSKHLWSNLGWLVDIAEIARGGQADWPRVMELAERHRGVRRMALGLELARSLLDAPLAPSLRDWVRASGIVSIAERLVPAIVAPEYCPPRVDQALRFQLALLDRAGDRARQLAATAFLPSPGDWQYWRLPRPLFFLYWVLRPVRLFAKYVLRLGARESRLPPGLVHHDGDGVGQVEASVPGAHRQA